MIILYNTLYYSVVNHVPSPQHSFMGSDVPAPTTAEPQFTSLSISSPHPPPPSTPATFNPVYKVYILRMFNPNSLHNIFCTMAIPTRYHMMREHRPVFPHLHTCTPHPLTPTSPWTRLGGRTEYQTMKGTMNSRLCCGTYLTCHITPHMLIQWSVPVPCCE